MKSFWCLKKYSLLNLVKNPEKNYAALIQALRLNMNGGRMGSASISVKLGNRISRMSGADKIDTIFH